MKILILVLATYFLLGIYLITGPLADHSADRPLEGGKLKRELLRVRNAVFFLLFWPVLLIILIVGLLG